MIGPYPNGDSFPQTVTAASEGTRFPVVATHRVMIQLDPDAANNVEICYGQSYGGGVILEPGEVWTGAPANLSQVWGRAVGAAVLCRVSWESC